MKIYTILLGLIGLILFVDIHAQQLPDTAFSWSPVNPKYNLGKGPVIGIDAGHHNFHTASVRYKPFAKVLESDGYHVEEITGSFTPAILNRLHILVISNALDSSNVNAWRNPVQSAFSPQEIMAISEWVNKGGRLFIIADHMPFGGAALLLASQFKFQLCNCFAMDNRRRSVEMFSLANNGLMAGELLRTGNEKIDSIVTFTGSAFRIPEDATPVIRLEDYTLLSPNVAWEFREETPSVAGNDYYQLAYKNFGRGKVVLSGEAAMFTSQIVNGKYTGLTHPDAKNNIELLRNLIFWLDNAD